MQQIQGVQFYPQLMDKIRLKKDRRDLDQKIFDPVLEKKYHGIRIRVKRDGIRIKS